MRIGFNVNYTVPSPPGDESTNELSAAFSLDRTGKVKARTALNKALAFAAFVSSFKGAGMPMLIFGMGFAEPFAAVRAVHGGRDKVAGVAIRRDGLTGPVRSSSESLLLHRNNSGLAQEYRNLLGRAAARTTNRQPATHPTDQSGSCRTLI